jgi:VIT1/CCC1 family predicted Fe2+/Mn2+ transporter
MGYLRGYVLKKNKLALMAESVSIGVLCAGVAYLVGHFIASVV